MANISITFGSFTFNATNNITVSRLSEETAQTPQVTKIPKQYGSVAETALVGSKTITIEGDIAGTSYDNLQVNINAFKTAILNGIQQLSIDDTKYIMAQVKGSIGIAYEHLSRYAKWKVSFIAHYPFWLSETLHTDERTPVSGAGYTINNAGNAPCRVKIEITAPGGGVSDNIQVENTTRGELCKYRGDVTQYETLEIDNRVDTDDFQVLNDSVDDTVNFEGDFINLSPGDNTIEFTGTANCIVKLSYHDAWY